MGRRERRRRREVTPVDLGPNANTPEARISQAAGFASWTSSGGRISRTRGRVLLFLGLAVLLVLVGIPLLVAFIDWI